MPHIIILGTLDTKLSEILCLRSQLLRTSIQGASPMKVTLIDCGRTPDVKHEAITIRQSDLVSRHGPSGQQFSMSKPRGEVVEYMAHCASACVRELVRSGGVHGVLSAGGSGGSSLAATVMREAVPIGLPKLIVSTVASGDTGPFIGETDISMMYSVVDIAGTNELLRNILANAAGAMAGMAAAFERYCSDQTVSESFACKSRKGSRVAITMFGVTTPCVDKVRQRLETKYLAEVYVFHATGHGGKAMERLLKDGRLDAVLDITTTEICDFLVGGNMSAGPKRLDAALRAGVPNVLSLGATDMVNFGPMETVPERYRDRKLFAHNANVTLMRTSKEECRQVGSFLVEKVRKLARNPALVEIWFPRGGVSMIATPGAAFEDAAADKELRDVIRDGLKGSGIRIVEDERDINDEGFALDIADSLMRLTNSRSI